jgi:hypothetical protein
MRALTLSIAVAAAAATAAVAAPAAAAAVAAVFVALASLLALALCAPLARWRLRSIPGPRSLPIVGSLPEVLRRGSFALFSEYRERYGGAFQARARAFAPPRLAARRRRRASLPPRSAHRLTPRPTAA